MPKLIKDGVVTEDAWLGVDESGSDGHILSLEQWQAAGGGKAVQLEPDQPPAPLLNSLGEIELVSINFTNFMDGRGFSYARELRERGFSGEIRAVGLFIRDQLHYMTRCGFNAFQFDDASQLEDATSSIGDFSEHYQAAVDEPQPLFRRR